MRRTVSILLGTAVLKRWYSLSRQRRPVWQIRRLERRSLMRRGVVNATIQMGPLRKKPLMISWLRRVLNYGMPDQNSSKNGL